MLTIKRLLDISCSELNLLENGTNEARWLLEYLLGKKITITSDFIEPAIEQAILSQYKTLVQMRKNHFPLAYLLGTQEFYGREFIVTPAVLVPRIDTEIIVTHALTLMTSITNKHVLDLGCGSGNIALTLGLEDPAAQILGIDCYLSAIQIANLNKKKLQAQNVSFALSNYYDDLQNKKFDFIVSNPPYVCVNSLDLQQGGEFEPHAALFAHNNGINALEIIIHQAPRYLNSMGFLLVEHGYDQQEQVTNLFLQTGFSNVQSLKDLNGLWRACVGQFCG